MKEKRGEKSRQWKVEGDSEKIVTIHIVSDSWRDPGFGRYWIEVSFWPWLLPTYKCPVLAYCQGERSLS
jgi:hypothetical protein